MYKNNIRTKKKERTVLDTSRQANNKFLFVATTVIFLILMYINYRKKS